ncbi:L-galactonate transporter [compost metagenome]
MVSVIAPKRKVASIGSIQNFGGYLGGSFAPVITGWVVQTTGTYEGALVASGVIAVLGAIAYFFLVKEPIPANDTPLPLSSPVAEQHS